MSIKALIKLIIFKFKDTIYNGEKYAQLIRSLGVKVGKGCSLYSNVSWGSEPYLITLGNYVRITKGVKFVTHDGGLWTLRRNGLLKEGDIFGKIVVGDNTHIGWDTIIMPGVTIGKNCVIGCGAVVTKDIPDNSVAAGVPARVIKTLEAYYESSKGHILNTKGMTKKEKRKFLESYYHIN